MRRDFTLLWAGMGVSQLGTQVQRVAIAWQLYLLTHSPLSLGLLGLFRVAPVLLLALGAGVVADSVDRRRLVMLTQSLMALASAALAVMTATGHASATAIYALSFLTGMANAFDNPARQALVPALVPASELPSALSLNITTWQVASVIGPGLGGLLLRVCDRKLVDMTALGAHPGLVVAYALDALSFIAVIAALAVMRFRAPASSGKRPSLAAAIEGLRFARAQPVILWMMLLDFAGTFLAGATLLMPVFADRVLHVGTDGLGLLLAAPAVGAVATALAMSWLPPPRARGVVVLVSVVIYGASIAVFGLSTSFALSLVALAVSGAADTVSMIVRQTIRQLLTPDEMRGRMTSVNMIFFMGGPQLGEVEAGLVATWIGAPLSVATGGIACAVFAIVVAIAVPIVRRHRADS